MSATPLTRPNGPSVRERLRALARVDSHGAPVVSVYLNTGWSDERQRDRPRAFLKAELRRYPIEHERQEERAGR